MPELFHIITQQFITELLHEMTEDEFLAWLEIGRGEAGYEEDLESLKRVLLESENYEKLSILNKNKTK